MVYLRPPAYIFRSFKRFSSLLLLCLCYLMAHTQPSQPYKTVFLTDGTHLRGTVIVDDSAGYVIVESRRHEIHYYDTSLVAKIEEGTVHHLSYDLKPRGYICNIEIGGADIIARKDGTSLPGFTASVVNSYLLSPHISMGVGVGGELSDHNIEMFSVYASTRIYFIKSNVGPYLDLTAGYCSMFMKYTNYDTFILRPPTLREWDSGLMVNPSIGVRIAAGRMTAMTASIGYKLYYLRTSAGYYAESSDGTFKPDPYGFYFFNAVTIKVGFEF